MKRLSKTLFQDGRYEVLDFVGEGGMQLVYKTQDHLLKRVVALKTPKNSSAEKRFQRSAILSAKINHHNVAKTLDYFVEDDKEYLIEELVDGLDLKEAIISSVPRLDPSFVAKVLHELAKGVAASHHSKVVHRDLKPSNIMIVGTFNLKEIKITDFGIAKMAEEEIKIAVQGGEESIQSSQTMKGAIPYMAPEMIQDTTQAGEPSDIWALGAIAYHLLTGKKPFGDGLAAVGRILQLQFESKALDPQNVKLQFREQYTELQEIILSCLKLKPSDRPTADELCRKCELICYSMAKRYVGTLKNLKNSFGFINTKSGDDVFFHFESFYGLHPKSGQKVMYSKFDSPRAPRAHPVIPME